MSKTKRIWTIIKALFAIQGAVLLMLIPSYAFDIIALGACIYLLGYGSKYLLYYLTHAQHMVGGKWFLLLGLILFDVGVLATTLLNQAKIITLIFILGIHSVIALLGLIRAAGNRKDHNPGWKVDFVQGIIAICQITLCLIYIRSDIIPVYSYCIYAICSSILTIVSAFKKSAIVYVQ